MLCLGSPTAAQGLHCALSQGLNHLHNQDSTDDQAEEEEKEEEDEEEEEEAKQEEEGEEVKLFLAKMHKLPVGTHDEAGWGQPLAPPNITEGLTEGYRGRRGVAGGERGRGWVEERTLLVSCPWT